MKRIICMVLVLVLTVPVFAGTLAEDRQVLEDLKIEMEMDHALEIAIEKRAERIATIMACFVNGGFMVWGFNQGSTYGAVTGVLFGLSFGGNVKDLYSD